jgi:ATP-dependent RNA helicase DDX27
LTNISFFNVESDENEESEVDEAFEEDSASLTASIKNNRNTKETMQDVTSDESSETKIIQRKSRKNGKEYFAERLLEPTQLAESFDELNLSRPLLKVISEMGYHQPTPIQQQTLPVALNGRDVCASAVTGSGTHTLCPVLSSSFIHFISFHFISFHSISFVL